MSGATTELNLSTAVDSDDNADYLTLSLANSLRTVDGLFNNITGHTHGGAHQGGPIASIPAGSIPDGSITSAKIADGTIATADLANASVTNAKLGSDTARLNLLTNGGFEIWQRAATAGAFGAYASDRWANYLSGTDTLALSSDTANADTGSATCMRAVFGLGTGGGNSIFAQILKSTDGYVSASRTFSFSMRVKGSVANAARAYILDATNGTYTHSTFHSGGGGYETLTVTATLASNCTVVYVGGKFAASGTFYFDNAMLVVGSQYADYAPLHPADDLARCLRYYEILSPEFGAYANAGSQGMGYGVPYKAHKPVTPTITKVGTWGATNCGQPQSVTRAGLSGTGLESAFIFATSTAAGYVQFYSFDATCGISVEANP